VFSSKLLLDIEVLPMFLILRNAFSVILFVHSKVLFGKSTLKQNDPTDADFWIESDQIPETGSMETGINTSGWHRRRCSMGHQHLKRAYLVLLISFLWHNK
jgi:hypothetical protein